MARNRGSGPLARKFLYLIAGIVALLLLAGVLVRVFRDEAMQLALEQMKPRVAFAEAAMPPAPDYADPASWAARPGSDAEARVRPPGVAAGEPLPVDIFFIHPTTYLGNERWNAPLDDPRTLASLPRVLSAQASPFADSGRLFAPRYRQVAFGAFLVGNGDTEAALMTALADVAAAFDHYVANDNDGRPFILAGHSQGAILGMLLLERRIDGTPLADRLIAAWLPGWSFSVDEDIGALADIGACEGPEDTGCVLAWQSFAADGDPTPIAAAYAAQTGLSGRPKAGTAMLCTNPLDWRPGSPRIPASAHLGAVGHAASVGIDLAAPQAGMLSAGCDDAGFLRVVPPPGPPFTEFLLPGGNYHVYDLHLFSMDVRANARARALAWLGKRR